ncbi:sulfurtransferase [Ahniella affigens]|uniref:Sulfurtransferase n=1 Tax=Ahniella affigens TaxID=2021234 RepID=A0A2P1PMQ8_9GAMM|nr:sulfurtransferase [Ahniella affigens]AVP96131.1 sulfurtransferase [Ahniella affigens]
MDLNTETLIDVTALKPLLGQTDLLLVDCRFDLMQPDAGRQAFEQLHLAGAVYADVNQDLSDQSLTGLGRHPLPTPAHFAETLSRLGFRPEQAVVVYDQGNGAYAARLWWMLRWIGHRQVAVLNGGFQAAQKAGLPMTSGAVSVVPSQVLDLRGTTSSVLDYLALDQARQDPSWLLIDARGAERYRGDVEPIDPVAGHIPGAINRPFTQNLDSEQRFLPPAELRMQFQTLLGARSAEQVVHQCGSGITACHNLLAMTHAGLVGSKLFAPSWSGWISDPSRPISRGD